MISAVVSMKTALTRTNLILLFVLGFVGGACSDDKGSAHGGDQSDAGLGGSGSGGGGASNSGGGASSGMGGVSGHGGNAIGGAGEGGALGGASSGMGGASGSGGNAIGGAGEGGASGSAGSPPSSWTACNDTSECVLTPMTCCGSCGAVTPENAAAVNVNYLDQFRAQACGEAGICPDCFMENDPRVSARCDNGYCVVELALD